MSPFPKAARRSAEASSYSATSEFFCSLQDELFAAVAAFVISGPTDALHLCQVSSTAAKNFDGPDLWGHAVRTVRWPPCTHHGLSSRERVAKAYSGIGTHCRSLVVDGHRRGVEDLLSLAHIFPRVHRLEVTGIGAEGIKTEVWHIWASSLRRCKLAFFYDAVDGMPALTDVLEDVVKHSPELEDLAVSGMDWPSAPTACVSALCRPGAVRLKRLVLSGSEARVQEEFMRRILATRPKLQIVSQVVPGANLDW